MTTMIAEVYDAFKSAGADDGKARAAASALADYKSDMADMKADIKILKWAVGVNSALVVVVLALVMRLSFAIG